MKIPSPERAMDLSDTLIGAVAAEAEYSALSLSETCAGIALFVERIAALRPCVREALEEALAEAWATASD